MYFKKTRIRYLDLAYTLDVLFHSLLMVFMLLLFSSDKSPYRETILESKIFKETAYQGSSWFESIINVSYWRQNHSVPRHYTIDSTSTIKYDPAEVNLWMEQVKGNETLF